MAIVKFAQKPAAPTTGVRLLGVDSTGAQFAFDPATKADQSALTTGLANKADAAATSTALAGKADATATATALASKADASALSSYVLSTALTATLNNYLLSTARGATNGVASLVSGKHAASESLVPSVVGQTGAITSTQIKAALLALGLAPSEIGAADASATTTALATKAPLASPTFTGTVTLPSTTNGLAKANVGLGNVDNTADTAKPVSTAQQTALDAKAPAAAAWSAGATVKAGQLIHNAGVLYTVNADGTLPGSFTTTGLTTLAGTTGNTGATGPSGSLVDDIKTPFSDLVLLGSDIDPSGRTITSALTNVFVCVDFHLPCPAAQVAAQTEPLSGGARTTVATSLAAGGTGGRALFSGSITIPVNTVEFFRLVTAGTYPTRGATVRFRTDTNWTAPSAPATPTGVTAILDTGVVTLTWTASTNATGYVIWKNGLPYDRIGSFTSPTWIDPVTGFTTDTYAVSAAVTGAFSAKTADVNPGAAAATIPWTTIDESATAAGTIPSARWSVIASTTSPGTPGTAAVLSGGQFELITGDAGYSSTTTAAAGGNADTETVQLLPAAQGSTVLQSNNTTSTQQVNIYTAAAGSFASLTPSTGTLLASLQVPLTTAQQTALFGSNVHKLFLAAVRNGTSTVGYHSLFGPYTAIANSNGLLVKFMLKIPNVANQQGLSVVCLSTDADPLHGTSTRLLRINATVTSISVQAKATGTQFVSSTDGTTLGTSGSLTTLPLVRASDGTNGTSATIPTIGVTQLAVLVQIPAA